MKWWEAGTVVVEVSGYVSCTDHCSYGTSRSDLMRRRLSERLCHSDAKPYLSQSFRELQELETSERPGHKLVARLPRQIRLKRG